MSVTNLMPPRRRPRPAIVSFIGYCLIGNVIAALPYGFILLNDPERRGDMNPATLLLIGFVGPLLMAALGHFILKGKNWARLLFFSMSIPYSILLLDYQMGAVSLLRVMLLMAFAFFLAHAASQRFFTGRERGRRRVPAKPLRDERAAVRGARYQY
jgi:hypothetical protein